MTFKAATLAQRVAIRDTTYKLGNLVGRLTLGHGPVDSPLSDSADTLALAVLSALGAAGYEQPLQPNEAKVTAGEGVFVYNGTAGTTGYPGAVTIDKNEIGRINLSTATQAVAADGDAISIQDRNSVTLLGTGVLARVSANRVVSAYFSGLTYAISSDGNPLNITTARAGTTVTGRVRLYVANNVLTNVYLDATAALQTGATVPVQNSAGLSIGAGTVTVTNNLVTAAKLPATITAFADGKTHAVTDIPGHSVDVPVKVSNGNYVSQVLPATAALALDAGTMSVKGVGATAVNATLAVAAGVPTATLPGTNAIVADAQVLTTADGGTVTFAIANGVITATYAAKAS